MISGALLLDSPVLPLQTITRHGPNHAGLVPLRLTFLLQSSYLLVQPGQNSPAPYLQRRIYQPMRLQLNRLMEGTCRHRPPSRLRNLRLGTRRMLQPCPVNQKFLTSPLRSLPSRQRGEAQFAQAPGCHLGLLLQGYMEVRSMPLQVSFICCCDVIFSGMAFLF